MLYDGIFKCVINYRLNVVQVFSPGSQTPPENFYGVLYPCTNGISCGNFRKLLCHSLSFIRRRKFVLRLIKFHSLPRPCSRNCCNSYLFNSAFFQFSNFLTTMMMMMSILFVCILFVPVRFGFYRENTLRDDSTL